MLRLVPLCWVGLLAGLEGGARPRSYRGPALAELGHPDVTTGDAACLRRYSKVQQRDGVILAPTGGRRARARHIFPPRLRRGTRRTDAPPLLAPLRRASVRHPEGASGKRGCTQRMLGQKDGVLHAPLER